MSQSYQSIRDGIRQHSMSVNEDVSGSSDDESSSLLQQGSSRSHSDSAPHLYTIPDPQGNTVQVELIDVQEGSHNQHSLVTIFSLWNTMMGTSLLSMPWAVKQAGFVNGIVLLVVMAGINAYTSYRVLTAGRGFVGTVAEFSDMCRQYLGRVAEVLAIFFSLLTLLGGAIVYWILMSNFLYHIGMFIYSHTHQSSPPNVNMSSAVMYTMEHSYSEVTCNNQTDAVGYEDPDFQKAWSETKTVPLYLVVILFPLFNFKSPTFFTKFNALGTLSVTYLSVFVAVKASQWGINLDLNKDHSEATSYSPAFEWSFPALTGVAALAYFVQNSIIAIVRNQKHPENNVRDLIIAYILVCVTYTYMGAVFYAAFPLSKSCVEDNFLNNLASTDIMAFVARIGLFMQMMCVLPLLLFIIRAQLFQFIFHSVWPSIRHVLALNVVVVGICLVFAIFLPTIGHIISIRHVLALNVVVVGICLVFAIFLPTIGHIISFVGAFCGFSYAMALPCSVYLSACYRQGTLSIFKIVFHGFIMLLGLANFVAQFVIIGHTQ